MTQALRHFRLEEGPEGRVTAWMDVADRSVNVLTEEVLDELDALIAEWESASSNAPIIIRSAKEKGFAAGADLERVAALQTIDEVDQFLRRGQRVFGRLACLSRPTVALITGACLGGGLELAMSCRYRFAVEGATPLQLGLPETRLGLIPGWGGTQRLPRLFGLAKALDMLLSGEAITLTEELFGLVDDILQEPHVEPELSRWIDGIIAGNGPETSVPQVVSASEYQAMFAAKAQNWISKENPEPAREAVVTVVRAGWPDSIDAGLDAERSEFCKLIFTDTCRRKLDEFLTRRRK